MRTYLRDLCIRLACMLDPGADVIVRHRPDLAVYYIEGQMKDARAALDEIQALRAAAHAEASAAAQLRETRDDAARELEVLRAQLGDA